MPDTMINDTLSQAYADPVARLLTVGDVAAYDKVDWPDYAARFDLGPEHIPGLIRMACDQSLHRANVEGTEAWAPIHAWRALAQFQAVEAVQPLLEFSKIEEYNDAIVEEFSTVYGMIGPAAITPIETFLADRTLPWLASSLATRGLAEIGRCYTDHRDECVQVLIRTLEHASDRDPAANGFTISSLLDLKAAEAIDVIREAIRLDAVDWPISGDLETVEIELGLRERRNTPRRYFNPFGMGKSWPKGDLVITDLTGEDDEFVEPRASPKIGRNQPCPCGSGKKYKKCCL